MPDEDAQPAAPSRPRRARRTALILAAAALFAWTAAPVQAARGVGAPIVTASVSTSRTRTVDLSRSGTAVTQFTSYWCVPAAAQTMLNIIRGTTDRSYATQSRLYTELRRANLYRYTTRGNDVRGWARVLTARLPAGVGYTDMSFASQTTAFAAIADTLDRTRRPVGIVIDAGTHAWTVVGVTLRESTAPGSPRTVLGFYVIGPLGAPTDPWPKQYMTVAQLATRFTRYHESTQTVIWEGRYAIVAPVSSAGRVTVTR